MNIRDNAHLNPNYCEINREERNYAAILFAALWRPGNVKRFLELCGVDGEFDPQNDASFGIYFEYAYLRDLWYSIPIDDVEESNRTKRQIIRSHLPISGIEEILSLEVKDLNEKFGVARKASDTHIQFPGKWAIVKYQRHFPNDVDFLNICRFKWSFNIKPDIVIHLDKNTAICVEAKYESGEGSYPSSDVDNDIFQKRGLGDKRVGQRELQKYMMEELLGVQTKLRFLVREEAMATDSETFTWKQVFDALDLNGVPRFALEMINNACSQSNC